MNRKELFDSFSGKRVKKDHKLEEIYKSSDETDISSLVSMDTMTESSSDNLISFEEKSEIKDKISGLDDIIIPSFFNDFKMDKNVNNAVKSYNEIKSELGSAEIAMLYLINIKGV